MKVVMAEVRTMVEVVMVTVTKMRTMVAMGGVRMMATMMVAMMKCW